LESRSLLKLISDEPLFQDIDFALNELTVSKVNPDSMISISVSANGAFLNNYWADGLIVATPTGSTAYSLSCGGPIITPDSKTIIITPISIHNLTVRPLVLPDNAVIEIKVEARNEQFSVSLDSRMATASTDTKLIIRKEVFNINLVQIDGKNFFTTLRDKLMWGQDKRN
jgi:NAD+ kinase